MQDSKPNDSQKQATQTDNFAAALRGDAPLAVGDVIQRSWDITLRALPMMLIAVVVLIIMNGVVASIAESVFPVNPEQLDPRNSMLQSLLSIVFVAPFTAVVTLMGLKNARDAKPGMECFAHALRHTPQVLAITFIMSLAVMILAALFFLIFGIGTVAVSLVLVTAIYFQFSFLLAIPLVLERGLKVNRAILASFLVMNKKMFTVLGIYVVLFIIIFISALPLFLGLIFTFPMSFNVVGVIYNRLIGVPNDNDAIAEQPEETQL
jgi:hypothetical protein